MQKNNKHNYSGIVDIDFWKTTDLLKEFYIRQKLSFPYANKALYSCYFAWCSASAHIVFTNSTTCVGHKHMWWRWIKRDDLIILFITNYSPTTHKESNTRQSKNLMSYTTEVSTSYEYRSYGINEVAYRVNISGKIDQWWHRARRCKLAWEQQDNNLKEPHNKDSLLHCIRIVWNNQSERRKEQCQQHRKQIDECNIAHWSYTIQ